MIVKIYQVHMIISGHPIIWVYIICQFGKMNVNLGTRNSVYFEQGIHCEQSFNKDLENIESFSVFPKFSGN